MASNRYKGTSKPSTISFELTYDEYVLLEDALWNVVTRNEFLMNTHRGIFGLEKPTNQLHILMRKLEEQEKEQVRNG